MRLYSPPKVQDRPLTVPVKVGFQFRALGLEIIPEIANRVSDATFVLTGKADSDSRDLWTKIAQRNKARALLKHLWTRRIFPFEGVSS